MESECYWSNDQNNWPINWQRYTNIKHGYLPNSMGQICLSIPKSSTDILNTNIDLSARLFSRLLKAQNEYKVKCLQIVYLIQFHHTSSPTYSNPKSLPKLALLHRQMG